MSGVTGRALVTGGAGFIGSHLCDRLLALGWEVVAVDDLSTGNEANLADASSNPRFRSVRADVVERLPDLGPLGLVAHLASRASPVRYAEAPLETLRVGAEGSWHALEAARAAGATFLLASTSEVYGDPLEHPQREVYRGNVDPVGPRSMYDESKRYAEALATAYGRVHGVPIRIARIFNTYGPRMDPRDGRALPTFLHQARAGEALTVHGDGTQTRSFCHVDDLVEGLVRLATSAVEGPVNLGNPEEVTVRDLAERVIRLTGSASEVALSPRPADDPERRRPDISRATAELGWRPAIGLDEGLRRLVEAGAEAR